MKAIVTKYLPATDHKPSRVKAKAEGVPAVIISGTDHRKAALTLCRKYGWGENLISGGMPDQTGECFVFANEAVRLQIAVDALLVAVAGVSGVEAQRRFVIDAQRSLDQYMGGVK